jgi:homoserine dehydrogenase
MEKKIRLGLFGFGCVGQGLYNVLNHTRGINATVRKICIRHPDKKRTLEAFYFTTNRYEVLDDPDIDVIVEMIDDVQAAYEIVTYSLKHRKAVVSANKKMIAEHFDELIRIQTENKVSFLYEASCCAGIPIIRNLEEYYDNELLRSVEGILNGSTNYILTHIFQHDKSFDKALKEAQEMGFAESDPRLDIEGFDAKYKLMIILVHAFGIVLRPEDVFNYGIQHINDFDIRYANEKNMTIKLIARCRRAGNKVYAYCMPEFVPVSDTLNKVSYEYNGIILEGAFSENQFFMGKGAGGNSTGSAVLSDISALTYDYKYEYKKIDQHLNYKYSHDHLLEVFVRYNGKTKIDTGDFEHIEVRYESPEFNYIIAKINLQQLMYLKWIADPEINIILTENND